MARPQEQQHLPMHTLFALVVAPDVIHDPWKIWSALVAVHSHSSTATKYDFAPNKNACESCLHV